MGNCQTPTLGNCQPPTLDNCQTPTVGNCVQASDKSNDSMPTVPVLINGTLQTFAWLDTGSGASFCSRRLTKELKLQGDYISY